AASCTNQHPLLFRTNAPSRRRRLLSGAIDGALFEHTHGFRNGALELGIMTGNDFFGPVLNVNVRGDAFVLDRPTSIAGKEATTRRNHRAPVNEWRRVG